jgi:antagonist of KipI
MRVLRPGLLTTVQDLGRHGLQQYGIGPGGAMDTVALRVANLLVGNVESAAGLEITLKGPTIQFESEALIAIGGGNLSATIAGRRLPTWRPVGVGRDSVLSFEEPVSGCRAYLAVAGGIDVPVVLGSRSTHLRARFGGFEGQALRSGDKLETGPPSPSARRLLRRLAVPSGGLAAVEWSVSLRGLGMQTAGSPARVIRGTHFDRFTPASGRMLFDSPFRITPQSDRMGYRLSGPLLESSLAEMVSEPVCTGTIQVPPEGQPIVLMADRQTTGGYPRIGQVITVDLPLLAQLKPGESVTFTEVSLEEAQRLYLAREMELEQVAKGVKKELEKQ